MEKIIIANHKMNLDLNDVNNYLEKLKNYKDKFIVFPSNIYLPYFINSNYKVGIQNIYKDNFGSFTGEVSPYQAKKLGVNYVLIGHSERRDIFHEDNELINAKVKKALENNLKVVLCVGETLEERESGKTLEVIKSELSAIGEHEDIIVAYEPGWSIQTGKIPSNEEIKEVVNFIKKCYNVKVLYGGSVSAENIEMIKSIKQIDGYLVGGASTKIDEFIKIIEVACE